MAIPVPKIELGVDAQSSIAPFFKLDNNTTGVLDNVEYRLGGLDFFVDITNSVRNYSVSRGKNQEFAQFTVGQATIELNNQDRTFDPLYDASPLAGQIVPRRQIKISANDQILFSGWVDDWNFSYLPNDDSIAEAVAYDAFSIIAGQTVTAGTPTPQLSGLRINSVLDDPNVNWSESQRDIDSGFITVGSQEITEGQNALDYLQKITLTEQGLFFISKDGTVTFRGNLRPLNAANSIDFNDTTGIPFTNLSISYGAEELFNKVIVNNVGGSSITVDDLESQQIYGIRTYTGNDLLGVDDTAALEYAISIADQYSTPEYRINGFQVLLHKLHEDQIDQILDLELGSIARISFTPNNISPAITQYAEIIRIDHVVSPSQHVVEFGFRKLTKAELVLDDEVFGRLDASNVLGIDS